MKLKQLFCKHDFYFARTERDEKQKCWIKIHVCRKCQKEVRERHYPPTKCKLSGKVCIHDNDRDFNCRVCEQYYNRHYYGYKEG